MPKSYVGMSRVRDAATLLLAQPLAPCPFRMGTQPGPTLLLQCLEGKLTKAELEKAWARAEGGECAKESSTMARGPMLAMWSLLKGEADRCIHGRPSTWNKRPVVPCVDARGSWGMEEM